MLTKKEAKEALWSNGHSDSNWIIDKIYDDFEQQLKAKDDEIKTLKSEHGYEKCKKCTHYSCGTQTDSFGWKKCGWDWECKSYFEDHFELKDTQ